MKQFLITSAMGKRLIAKAMVVHPSVQAVLKEGTLVIVAGSTNGYVAEEILLATNQAKGFTRKGFRRGVTVAPTFKLSSVKAPPACDVVLIDGLWQKGKEIFDVINDMHAGDVVLKGGNALDLSTGQVGVQIIHPMGGTAGAAISAVIGRRVQMIVPIGLEKRVCGNLFEIACEINAPGVEGPRMHLLPGKAFTELDAIALLTGARAKLVAAGGVYGAEGSVWLAVCGESKQVDATEKLIKSVENELPYDG